MAMEIFRRGTSPWEEEDDDEDNDDDDGVDFLTSTTKRTTITTEKGRTRRKKFGGALTPNVYTFGAILACAARDGDVDASMRIIGTLEEGTYPDVSLNQVIYSTVISACANYCVANDSDDRSEVDGPGAMRMSDDDIVKLALDVLNRGINLLSEGEGGGGMGVVGYNAVISTMARTGRWRMAVQLLGEMILHSSSLSTTASNSSLSSSSLLQRTNPNFLPMEIIRDDISSAPSLLHWPSSSPSSDDKNEATNYDNRSAIVPKPDAVTFGTVLSACEKSSQWNTLLDVARVATEYGVKLDGMALTSIMHSCQQLGLAGEWGMILSCIIDQFYIMFSPLQLRSLRTITIHRLEQR